MSLGVTLSDCKRELSETELETLVNIHPDLTSHSTDDRRIQTRHDETSIGAPIC